MKQLQPILVTGAKLAVCGAVIAAIAFAFVVLTPAGEVDSAGADVFWIGPGAEKSNQQRFVEMLQEEEFSEPQPYDYNGNTVYFARGQTRETPGEVAERVQQALVRKGLNERVYPVVADPTAIATAIDDEQIDRGELTYSTLAGQEFLTGGMIPIVDTGDYVALSGIETTIGDGWLQQEYDLEELPALIAQMQSYPGGDLADMVDNIRYIEAFRPRGSSTTRKVAVFGDGDLQMRNFAPAAGGQQQRNEQSVPACPGCSRNTSFSGMGSQEDYQMQSYDSPASPDGVIDFYERAMAERGWEKSTGAGLVDRMRARRAPAGADDTTGLMRTFVRGGDMVQIHAYRGGDGTTHVNVFRGE